MSLAFVQPPQKKGPPPNQASIQKVWRNLSFSFFIYRSPHSQPQELTKSKVLKYWLLGRKRIWFKDLFCIVIFIAVFQHWWKIKCACNVSRDWIIVWKSHTGTCVVHVMCFHYSVRDFLITWKNSRGVNLISPSHIRFYIIESI